LLSFDHEPATREPTVEIAHEALIRAWSRFKDWVSNSRDDLRQQRRLNELAIAWSAADEDPSYLLRGLQLQQFEAWMHQTSLALVHEEQAYLARSIEAHREQERLEEERLAEKTRLEKRARRIQRVFFVAVSVFAILGFVLSIVALTQREDAISARSEAEANAHIAQTQAALADNAAQIAENRADALQSLSLTEAGEDALREGRFELGTALLLEANLFPNPPFRSRQTFYANAPLNTLEIFSDNLPINVLDAGPRYLLTGNDAGVVTIWDSLDGSIIGTLEGHTGKIRALAYGLTGRLAVSGDDNNEAILWDVEAQQLIHHLVAHTNDVLAVAISPDETQVVTASRDESIILWDTATGEIIRTFTGGHSSRITTVAIHPNKHLLVSGGADNQLVVWSVDENTPLQTLSDHTETLVGVAFSPDGTNLISVSVNGQIILWETQTWTAVYRRSVATLRLTGVSFSPNGRLVALSAGSPFAGDLTQNAVLVWDVLQGQVIRQYLGHSLQVNDVAFSPDSRYIFSGSVDMTVRVWASDPQARFWRVQESFNSQGDMEEFTAIATDFQNQLITATIQNYTLVSWRLAGKDFPPERVAEFGANQHTDRINALAIHGNRLASASSDRTIIVWDLDTLQPLFTLTGHTNQVNDVAWSPDGQILASASRDRTVILWDGSTGAMLRQFTPVHTNSINSLAFSPDGQTLLSASEDRTLILWDVNTGQVIRRFTGHLGGVLDVVFLPDGQTALSVSQDQTLILWQVATGQALRTYEGHNDWVTKLSVSPNGQFAISVARDKTVRVWDLTGEDVQPLIRYVDSNRQPLDAVFINGVGEGLIVSTKGEMVLIPTSAETFLQWLQANRYLYSLTCQERTEYLLEPCASDPNE
jgi:WD40 repeat protein